MEVQEIITIMLGAMLVLILISIMAQIPFSSGTATACVLGSSTPKYANLGSGQTTCYDMSGNSRNCSGTGEDGEAYSSSFVRTFTDNGDGTLSDANTNLMWQKSNNEVWVNWQTALDYCNNLVLGPGGSEYTDWRLPAIGEIWTIFDYDTLAINPAFSTTYKRFWSSTTMVIDPTRVLYLYDYGSISSSLKDTANAMARCVRFEN